MDQILIRQAAESHIASIRRLQQQWFEEASVYGLMPESQEQIKALIGPHLLVAEAGDEVVGLISGSVHISEGLAVIPAGAGYLEIDSLYVATEFRRRGVGSSLITQLLAHAQQQGVAYALLYSAAKDIHSVLSFYERHGFRSWYVQMFREL